MWPDLVGNGESMVKKAARRAEITAGAGPRSRREGGSPFGGVVKSRADDFTPTEPLHLPEQSLKMVNQDIWSKLTVSGRGKRMVSEFEEVLRANANTAAPAFSAVNANSEGIESHVEAIIEAAIIQKAEQVIGDRSDAMRWLGTPVRALDYATPISLLHDFKGREQVLTVLGRLEHGIL